MNPTLFKHRSRPAQIILGGFVPAAIGVAAGILIGANTVGYWAIAGVAGIGGFIAGFEHQDGWGGADRGVVGGGIYGVALLVTHAIVGTEAKVSLGSFPPFFAVVTAIIGMFLGAAGGRIARARRGEPVAAPEAGDSP